MSAAKSVTTSYCNGKEATNPTPPHTKVLTTMRVQVVGLCLVGNYCKMLFFLQIILCWWFWYVLHPDNEGKSPLSYHMAGFCTIIVYWHTLVQCFTHTMPTNLYSEIFLPHIVAMIMIVS